MIIEDGLSEEFCIDVGINLGGENGFVTEHFLNGTEVGAHFDEVGGKGVAEGVGTNGFVDACFGGEVFDDVKIITLLKRAPLRLRKRMSSSLGAMVGRCLRMVSR